MPKLLLLPVVMLGLTKPDSGYPVPFGMFQSASDCAEYRQTNDPDLRRTWPEIVTWCAFPFEDMVVERPEPSLAPATSPIPRPRPASIGAANG